MFSIFTFPGLCYVFGDCDSYDDYDLNFVPNTMCKQVIGSIKDVLSGTAVSPAFFDVPELWKACAASFFTALSPQPAKKTSQSKAFRLGLWVD